MRSLTTLTPTKLNKIPDAEAIINEVLPELLEAMIALARGHKQLISRYDPIEGEVTTTVWDVPPDKTALAFLIDHVIGKAASRVELTGKDGGPLQVIPWMTMDEAVKMGLRPSLVAENGDEDVIEGEFTHATS